MNELKAMIQKYERKKNLIDVVCMFFGAVSLAIYVFQLFILLTSRHFNSIKDFISYLNVSTIVLEIGSLFGIWVLHLVLSAICDHIITNARSALLQTKSLDNKVNQTTE